MNALILNNAAPFGSERPYNALRVATTLSGHEAVELRVFLIGEALVVPSPIRSCRTATTTWIA